MRAAALLHQLPAKGLKMARREPGSSKGKSGKKKPAPGGLQLKGGKGAKPKAAKAKAEDRPSRLTGRPPSNAETESFVVYAEKVRKQDKKIQEAADALRGEKGTLNGIYSAMKQSGISQARVNVLKKTVKEEKRSAADRLVEAREMAWQAKCINSPAVQLGLFGDLLKEPSLDEYRGMGEHDGRNGESIDNAPGKAGSPENLAYIDGWHVGQKENAEKLMEQMGQQIAGDDTTAVH